MANQLYGYNPSSNVSISARTTRSMDEYLSKDKTLLGSSSYYGSSGYSFSSTPSTMLFNQSDSYTPTPSKIPEPVVSAKDVQQPNVKLTLAGLPRREGAVHCPYYMKTGMCKYGATCKFDHPPPGELLGMATSQGASLSVAGEDNVNVNEQQRWRSWMTSYYMERYLKNKTFYKLPSQSTIDNPDQRIVDDLSSFTGTTLSFALTLFNAAIDLISFSNILYGIYPPFFVVLLAYSLGGTAISVFLGRGLVSLNFLQEKKEADFRYGLVRVRENAESIAFYGDEENEMQLLLNRFRSAFENLNQLLISSRNLEFFTNGYRYLIQIVHVAVVAPMYFSGKIEFGVINQSASAFNHILGDFSLVIYSFQALSAFSAVIDRLGEFDDVLDSSNKKGHQDSKEEIQLSFCLINSSNGLHSDGSLPLSKRVKLLQVEHLTIQTPSEATLIKDLSFEIFEKDHLLVTGPSGSGKTSLLRAVAGLWSFGDGAITVYVKPRGDLDTPHSPDVVSPEVTSTNETIGDSTGRRNSEGVIFLPQKPYMVLGTLQQQLLYPTWTEDSDNLSDDAKQSDSLPFLMRARDARCVNEKPKKPTSDDLIQVLNDVSLGHLLSRFDGLDSTHEWSSVLSLGEQQRLAFGRLLLSKPTLALLDESTSALDEANEVL
ncbi:hypothetical protein K7X08_015068 [Anisodus acutangulus]|uniref:C3H1-type domain-containing protein n=1 Tax=Anisodus acutangulus TaxID=402998 RepID=A0A9Q1L5E9_9SOLA|nr:hypothetical protein K7X08_015068 [Anisodus acutangulus]